MTNSTRMWSAIDQPVRAGPLAMAMRLGIINRIGIDQTEDEEANV